MNLILLENDDFKGTSNVVLKGRRFDHLRSVNGVKKNDRFICGRLNGKMGSGLVVSVTSDSLEMEVSLEDDPPKPLPVTLVLALPRPKMLKRIIGSVTSMGVKKIFLINSWRVEKSFWQSPVLHENELNEQMKLGLEQARDTVLPQIYQKRFFTRFVEQDLDEISGNTLRILAHPKSLLPCPAGVNKGGNTGENPGVTLIIGPEGGFIDLEVATLEKQQFLPRHIGPRILRVETAVTSIISRLFY